MDNHVDEMFEIVARTRFLNFFIKYFHAELTPERIEFASENTKALWNFLDILHVVSPNQIIPVIEHHLPVLLPRLKNLISLYANKNTHLRNMLFETISEENVLTLLECLDNVTQEEVEISLGVGERKNGEIFQFWSDGRFDHFLQTGDDIFERRFFLTIENIIPYMEKYPYEHSDIYLTCPFKYDPHFRELFLRKISPIYICNLTFQEIVSLIDRADSHNTRALCDICKSLGAYCDNVELRKKILTKADTYRLAYVFQYLHEPSIEETEYVLREQHYSDIIDEAHRNLTRAPHRNNPNIRKLILEKSLGTEINNNIKRLPNPTYDEFLYASRKTANPDDLWEYCPEKPEGIVTKGSKYSHLCGKSDEYILDCFKKNPGDVAEIFINTFQKTSDEIRMMAIGFCPPERIPILHDYLPDPSLTETIRLFQRCRPENIYQLFANCYYKFDTTVREIAFGRVRPSSRLRLWSAMVNHSVDETLFMIRKTNSDSFDQYIHLIFSQSHLYEDIRVQDEIMNLVSGQTLIKCYCIMTNPTVEHSLTFLAKSNRFDLCAHRDTEQVVNFFIQKNIKIPYTTFMLFFNQNLQDEKTLLNSVEYPHTLERIFGRCKFNDHPDLRRIYLNSSSLDWNAKVVSLAGLSNVTHEEIALVTARWVQ